MNQQEGEIFEWFYADLQILLKTCDYCVSCTFSKLRDRIVLDILTLEIYVDTCKETEKVYM